MSLKVYTIVESNKEGEKPFWCRIGIAFTNKDGSINCLLNALPVNGKIHIREEEDKPREERNDAPKRGSGR